MKIQVLQETRSPVQMGMCLNGRLQSYFQLWASRPWSLQPCEHTSVLQLASLLTRDALTLSITTSVQERPPQQQSGALHWSPRASSSMHRQKHTPRNVTHTCKLQGKPFHWTPDTGHKKGHLLDLKSKLSSNLRCCHLDYAKALVCHQKSQPWMHLFTLLKGRQKAGDARQKQQHVLLPCKTEDHSSAVLSLQMN